MQCNAMEYTPTPIKSQPGLFYSWLQMHSWAICDMQDYFFYGSLVGSGYWWGSFLRVSFGFRRWVGT